jgi:23S rRNA pseudouridine1911/1915/1917 synthase
MQILYEDNHLIAVQKLHGMLTQGDETGDVNLLDEVKKFIKERDQKPGNVFLGLLHRLDRPVGGVVLFAKTSKGASRLSEQFRVHSIEKVYWAVVSPYHKNPEHSEGSFLASGSIVQWLVKDERRNVVTPYDREVPGSQRAELLYKVLEYADDGALVEMRPKTGRPHQIRVAMASKLAPIVGDVKYGSRETLDGNIALFARSLSFYHPISGERMIVTADPELEIFSFTDEA